jgi:phage gp29-like protein
MPNDNVGSHKDEFIELGSSGLRRSGGTITEEFLANLQGVKGFKVYREMRDNDPVIGAMLYAIDKVITRLEWHVEGEDERTATFVQECLDDMSDSWDATLQNILSMLVYGWSFHEIVYKIRGGLTDDPRTNSRFKDHRIGWRKWPVRAQETLQEWMIDDRGGIQGMVQIDPSGGGLHRIPIEKALLFRTTTNRNNPEGYSLLRNAYRPWFYKRRIEEIEAVGIERDLAGLPMAFVPPEYLMNTANPAQKAVLQAITDIVQNVKRNEQEGIVFPAAYDDQGNRVFDLQLLSASGGRQFDTGAVIQRYDQRIAMSLLSDFLLLGSDRVGSFALGTAKIDLWTLAVDSIAKTIAEVVNQYAIPRLLTLNAMRTDKLPYLTYGQVSSVELSDVADYVSKLVGVGAIMPDPQLEEHLRQLGDLPDSQPLV